MVKISKCMSLRVFLLLDFEWPRLNPHKSINPIPGRFEPLGYIIKPLEKPGRAGVVQKPFLSWSSGSQNRLNHFFYIFIYFFGTTTPKECTGPTSFFLAYPIDI
jgi:hypothetical protein